MTLSSPTILLGLLHGLGILAIVSMAYGSVMRRTRPGRGQNVAVGVLFGLGSVLTMLDPLIAFPGVVMDERAVLVALAGLFGGAIGTTITAGMAIIFRIYTGGIGMGAGIVGIVIAAVAGIAYAWCYAGRIQRFRVWPLTLLGVAASTMVFSVFLLPYPIAVSVFEQLALPLSLANIAGIVFLGRYLGRERARHEAALQFQQDARTDALTGLHNRRTFDAESGAVFDTAKRGQHVFSLVMIDIDHFKKINDVWGHAAGDAVLRRVSDIIVGSVRATDVVSRFGGEEIAVLMPRAGMLAARNRAERIRVAIEETVFDLGGIPVKVTVSAGAATFDGAMHAFSDMFIAADRALYRAKENGRNRVEDGLSLKAA